MKPCATVFVVLLSLALAVAAPGAVKKEDGTIVKPPARPAPPPAQAGAPGGEVFSAFPKVGAPGDTLTITSPNGGEAWTRNEIRAITWTSEGAIANVNLGFSTDNGLSWNILQMGTANDGSESWTIPYAYSQECLVAVESDDESVVDFSDAPFAIYSDAAEPNNTSGEAKELPLGTSTNLVFDGPYRTNDDWYSFYIPPESAGQDLKVNVRVTSPYPDPAPADWRSDLDFELLDGSLRVLGTTISGSDDETLYLHDVASGWYYLYVGYCTTDYADTSEYGVYSVTLETGTGFGLGYVSGRLLNSAGDPVADEFVFLEPQPFDWDVSRPYVTSGADGRFTVAYVPGTFTLLFNHAGPRICVNYNASSPNVVGEYYSDKKTAETADALSFAAGQTLDLGDITLDTGAILGGQTTYSGGPLSTVQVRAYDSGGNSLTYEYALSDSGGNYSLDCVPTTAARVRFSRGGFATEYYDDKPTLGLADVLTTAAGVAQYGIDAFLVPGGSISGTVTDGTGTGIGGVRVTLFSELDEAVSRTVVTTASSTGYYNFLRTLPGNYKLYFDTADVSYFPEWYDDAASFAAASAVSVSNNAATSGINAQLAPYTITVTAPNGGESWTAGSGQEITWTSTGGVGNVDIIYTYDNGSTWHSVIADTANDGSHLWTVPDTPAGNCYVQVLEHADGSPYDASDAPFTILTVPSPSLELTSPNGWEHWTLGSTKSITWNAVNYTGTVRLVLFKAGSRFGNIATGIPATNGSYSWTVGLTYDNGMAPEGADYRLYLRSTDGTLIDPSDYRLGLIDPAQLEVTAPNGGESWELGTTQNITWNANGYAGTVRLILFQKAAKIGQIVGSLPADQGSYAWTVGVHQAGVAPAGILYSIRVLAGDGSQDDFSDGPLTLIENDALIVDHQHTTLNVIPSEWLDQASREKLLILSAGNQDGITLGLRLLGDRDTRLATAGNASSLGLALKEGSWLPQGANLELQEWQWALEKAILDSQATVVVIRPDEQALLAGRLNAESYLSVLNELASRLPNIKLVCSTVAMDEPNELIAKFNRQVRESVLVNKGVLLDAADIESWRGGEQHVINDVPVRHPACRAASGMPATDNQANQGSAAWWLLARLAGWEG